MLTYLKSDFNKSKCSFLIDEKFQIYGGENVQINT